MTTYLVLAGVIVVLGVLLGVYVKKYYKQSEKLSQAEQTIKRLRQINSTLSSPSASPDDIAEWLS